MKTEECVMLNARLPQVLTGPIADHVEAYRALY